MFAGWYLGNRVFRLLDPARFRKLVMGVLLVSAALVLVRTLTGE
jgi:uncharacterized membrane protein YfcA